MVTMIVRVTFFLMLLTLIFGYRILEGVTPGRWSQLPAVTDTSVFELAIQNNRQAQFSVASAYQQRAFQNQYPDKAWWERNLGSRDYLEALYWLRKSATAGHLPAINQIGVHYLEGWGTQKDFDQAAIWLQKAVEQHFVPAMVTLARVQLERMKIRSHQRHYDAYYRSAFHLLTRAAESGDAAGQFWLGNLYNLSNQNSDGKIQAFHWWSLAAAQGFKPAIAELNSGTEDSISP